MNHSPRRTPALVAPVPHNLANSIGPQPEALAPSIRPGSTLTAAIEPLLGIDDLARTLNCSRRAIERLRAGGKLPAPDVRIGRMPRWKPQTIRAWIEQGGRP